MEGKPKCDTEQTTAGAAAAGTPEATVASGSGSADGAMRVLLTGGCGFIGSNLAHHILFEQNDRPVDRLVVLDSMTHGSDECNVTDLLQAEIAFVAASASSASPGAGATAPTGAIKETTVPRGVQASDEGQDGNAPRVPVARCRTAGRVWVVEGEFGDAPLVARLLADHEIDCVLHLAGETHVDRSYREPARCVDVNVRQLVGLLEAACGRVDPKPARRPTRFLHMSTDEVYGDASDEACGESAPMDPTNPYAASKGASELMVGAYRHSYGLPAVVVRCNNVYGPRQTRDKAIPRFTERALAGEPLYVHGSGLQTRNWVHARDACRAIWSAALRGAVGRAYNFGSDDEVSVIDVALAVRDIVASDTADGRARAAPVPVEHVPDRPHNDAHYRIDSSRIRAELGWRPTVPFVEGLADTVRWHMARVLADARASLSSSSPPTPSAPSGPARQRVLVYGHRGWIGEQVMRLLRERPSAPEVVAASARPGDDPDRAVEAELDAVRPTHVISLVGRTHGQGCGTVDYLEGGDPQRLHENVRDNLYAPVMLADAAVERGIHMTYLGTGCIYTYVDDDDDDDGDGEVHNGSRRPEARGFTEEDAPNFRGSAYSTVKAFTDRLVRRMGVRRRAAPHAAATADATVWRGAPLPEGGPVRATAEGEPAVLNVRIRMPISGQDHARDFVTKIASYARVMDVPNSVTVLPELLPAMLDLALDHRATGTVNLVNPGAISHNEVLAMYREIVDPHFVVRNFEPGPELDGLMARRSNCKLDASALVAACPSRVRSSHEAVRSCVVAMAAAMAAAAATDPAPL